MRNFSKYDFSKQRKDLERIRKNVQKTAKEYDWKKVIRKVVRVYERIYY